MNNNSDSAAMAAASIATVDFKDSPTPAMWTRESAYLWEVDVETHFFIRGLSRTLTDTTSSERENALALAILRNAIPISLKWETLHATSALELWNLIKVAERDYSFDERRKMKKDLETFNVFDVSSTKEYVNFIARKVVVLRNSGTYISTKEKINFFIEGVRSKSPEISDTTAIMAGKDVERVKNIIQSYSYLCAPAAGEPAGVNQVNARTPRGKVANSGDENMRHDVRMCHRCGKTGHLAFTCRTLWEEVE